jgi:hypothetical protein
MESIPPQEQHEPMLETPQCGCEGMYQPLIQPPMLNSILPRKTVPAQKTRLSFFFASLKKYS